VGETGHIWFNKLHLKYEKTCFTFALKYKEIFFFGTVRGTDRFKRKQVGRHFPQDACIKNCRSTLVTEGHISPECRVRTLRSVSAFHLKGKCRTELLKYMKKSKTFVSKWVKHYSDVKNVDNLPDRGSVQKKRRKRKKRSDFMGV